MHIVQLSLDNSLVTADSGAEPVRRQRAYAAELVRQQGSGEMTIIVVCRDRNARERKFGNLTIRPCHGSLPRWPAVFFELERLHRQNPISIITTQNVYNEAWAALVFKSFHQVPVVGQIHFDVFAEKALVDSFGAGLKGRVRWWLMAKGLRHFTRLRVVGRRTGEEIVRRRLQRSDRIYVLPVPVPMLANAGLQASFEEPRVLFVGRLVFMKNLGLWLRVAQAIARIKPNARFDIVGDGALKAELASLADSLNLGDRVVFHGAIPNEQLGRLYAKAHVFLLTSHYEGFGRVLVEAYGHGVPCVAVRNAGVEDIIEHGRTGFLHEANDESGLVGSVCRLLDQPELARRMGKEGETAARNRFAPEILTERNVAELVATARSDSAEGNGLMFRPTPREHGISDSEIEGKPQS